MHNIFTFKKALSLLAACLLTVAMQAQVKWHTIEEAAEAKIGTKLYMVDFYTSWCGYCKKMDRETFTNPMVAQLLNRYFYPVKFNAEGDNTFTWHGQTYTPGTTQSRTHSFAKNLRGYPSFVLFRADGTLQQIIPGYYPPDDFIVILWYFASGDYQRYPNFNRYQQLFNKNIRPTMEKQLKDNK